MDHFYQLQILRLFLCALAAFAGLSGMREEDPIQRRDYAVVGMFILIIIAMTFI